MTELQYQEADKLRQYIRNAEKDIASLNQKLCRTYDDDGMYLAVNVNDGYRESINIPKEQVRDVLKYLLELRENNLAQYRSRFNEL